MSKLPSGCSSFFLSLYRLLAALRCLRAEFLREPIDAPFGVDQLLAAGEKRMAGRADFEMQLGFGRTRFEGVAARAAHDDLVILRMDLFPHGVLLGVLGKHPLYAPTANP